MQQVYCKPYGLKMSNISLIKGLKLVGLGERIDVYTKEVVVSYFKTQQIIAEIWQTLKPKVKT